MEFAGQIQDIQMVILVTVQKIILGRTAKKVCQLLFSYKYMNYSGGYIFITNKHFSFKKHRVQVEILVKMEEHVITITFSVMMDQGLKNMHANVHRIITGRTVKRVMFLSQCTSAVNLSSVY